MDNKVYENRWLILAIVVIQPFMACLDGSIVNIALPIMAKNFSVSMASIEWVVTSYLIMISAAILLFGRLGDVKGKTTIFKYGLVVFGLGSLLCGISNNLILLVMSRVVQGIGASMTMATSQGIITQVFPANERGRALGISGTFVALGTMIGPPIGGFIISAFSWQYIFLINVPVAIVAFIFAMEILPVNKEIVKQRIDFLGAILFFIFTVLIFSAMIIGQQIGYSNRFIILSFIVSIISFIGFIMVQKKVEEPLLDLSIFKNRVFSTNILCAFISFTALSCVNIIHPFYLQDVLKITPGKAGIIMMIYPITLSLIAPLSGYLSDKIGSKILTLSGLFVVTLGFLFMSTLKENTSIIYIILFVAMLGLGNGLFQSPNNSLVMSTVPKNKLGIAGSVNALVRNLGFVFGVSASTTILYNKMSSNIGYRVLGYVSGREDVFVYAMKWVYMEAAIICFIAFSFSLIDKLKKR
ncbi:MFS transporter [Clostridium rectalis]|uniref:MFS transporter n=1 Tax=Clostridium rectalis TaxID=2040295 RepID=UPI000F62FD1F|nr:MFS transporter [Clostridium rectalis]